MKKNINELKPELLFLSGLNPLDQCVSGSRKQMFRSHLGQALTTLDPNVRSILTGVEFEYGKYTFSQKMPENGRILKIIDKYPSAYGSDSFKINPERVIIYESETGMIGMLKINGFRSDHPYFGFQYEATKESSELYIDSYIAKDTVLYDSPSKDEYGNYKYGTELNIAYTTFPGTSDDGIVISKDVLPRLATRTYERRIIEWGRDYYPINLYGDDDNYKIFPDIGDYVQPPNEHKGLLMCLREYDPATLIIDQSKQALKTIDNFFDKCVYVDGEGGRVVDINIIHQPPIKGESICDEMMTQAIKYRDANIEYRRKIVNEYFRLKKQREDSLELTPEFHRFIVESLAIINHPLPRTSENLRYIYKTNNVNEWRAEIVIEYIKVPTIGYKLTDTAGGKGVICKILEPEQMPMAANGVRADIIMDPASNVNRMKFSSLYEQFFNVTKYDLRKELLNRLGVTENEITVNPTIVNSKLNNLDDSTKQAMVKRLLRYHEIVSPRQYQWANSLSDADKVKYLSGCLKDKIYDYFPTDNDVYLPDVVQTLTNEFTSTYGPVTFKDEFGNQVVTKHPVRIGPVYILLLEKTGAEWSAVSVSKTQQNGIITYIAGKDKNAFPVKQQAIRVLGEAEMRGIISYIGPDVAIELHDRSNNTSVRKAIAETILGADKPTNINRIVDRNEYPLGYSQPLQILHHIINCCGFELVYDKYDPSKQKPKPLKEDE
jgi:hypothetical protein